MRAANKLEELIQKLEAFGKLQMEVEQKTDFEDLQKYINEAGEFRDKLLKVRVRAVRWLSKDFATQEDSDITLADGSRTSGSHEVKLPQLKLPNFSGAVIVIGDSLK